MAGRLPTEQTPTGHSLGPWAIAPEIRTEDRRRRRPLPLQARHPSVSHAAPLSGATCAFECPAATSLPQPGLLLAQVARQPRPRSSRPSPTQTISSSSEARGTPECPWSDQSPTGGGRVCGWLGGVGGWLDGRGGSWGGRVNDQAAEQGAGRPGVPRLWRDELPEEVAPRTCLKDVVPSPVIAGCPPGSGEDDLRKVPTPTRPRPRSGRRSPPRARRNLTAVGRVVPGSWGYHLGGGGGRRTRRVAWLVLIPEPWLCTGLRGARRGGGGLHHEGRQPQRHGLRLCSLPHAGERPEGAP